MKKSLLLGLFALVCASSGLAEDKDCCAQSASMKNISCDTTFAKLDLTAAQKSKMEKLAAACDKTGCSKEGMAKMEKGAKSVLTKEQFATWKSACDKMAQKSQG